MRDELPPIDTREEDGMRVSNANSDLRFPTDATLKEVINQMNEMAADHALKPCGEDDCELCFLTRAGAESAIFKKLVAETLKATLGPMGAMLVEPAQFFSTTFFFFMLATKIERSRSSKSASAEIDALTKLFNTPENPAGDVASNPS